MVPDKHSKPLFTRIFDNEFKSCVEFESQSLLDNCSVATNKIDNQALVYSVSPSMQSVQDILTNYRVPATTPDEPRFNGKDFLSIISDTIIPIGNSFTFAEAIQAIYTIYKTLGSELYGAIIKNNATGEIFNPLHILIAMSITPEVEAAIYSVIIYTYNGNRSLIEYDLQEADLVDKDKIDGLINNLIRTLGSAELTEPPKTFIEGHYIDGNMATINYRVEGTTGTTVTVLNIIANQFLTDGIAAPYYGVSLTTAGHAVTGTHLTPMTSCNIAYQTSLIVDQPLDTIYAHFNSVCTGSTSNRTLAGLQTLNHVNMGSPFSDTIDNLIRPGALAYVDASIAKSFEIYKFTNILKDSDEKTNTTTTETDNNDGDNSDTEAEDPQEN